MDGPIAKCFGTFVVRYIKYVPVDLYENPITPGPPNLTISPHRFQAENDAYPKILDRLQRIPSYATKALYYASGTLFGQNLCHFPYIKMY